MNKQSIIPFGAPASDYTGPKRALALSGGGMRLSYHAGALRALLESGLVFSHIDSTSGGSMTMAMLLSGQSPEELCNRWRKLDIWETVSFRPIKDYLISDNLTALGSAEGMINKVLPSLGININTIRQVSNMTGVFNVLDYGAKQVIPIPHQNIDAEMMVAGMSLPGVMPPLERDEKIYLDTGFVQDANLIDCVRRGCEEIWLLWGLGNTNTYHGGFLNLYINMLEMSANGALNTEIQQILDINKRINSGETVWGHSQPIRLHIIRHQYPLPLDPELYLNSIDNATLIDMGYADASAYLQANEDGSKISVNMTAQATPQPGIRFREMMKGGFSLGAQEPEKGAQNGQSTPLTLHATIAIHDLDTFIANPEHLGGLTGRISWSGFGEDIPAKVGVFNLFSPTEQHDLKLMIYELGFIHNGQDYYLAGKKEVRNQAGCDLWADTTTLYVKLYKGLDKSGGVVGAGILRLSVKELGELMTTFRAINANSLKEEASLVKKFSRFFLGELYESYIKPSKAWWKFW